jgi:hypothetical protein
MGSSEFVNANMRDTGSSADFTERGAAGKRSANRVESAASGALKLSVRLLGRAD